MRKAFVLVAFPLALAACGGGGGGGSAAKSSAPAAAPLAAIKAAAGKTARTSVHVKMSGSGTTNAIKIGFTGSGDFDNAQHLGAMNASFSAGGASGTIDEVMSGTTIYMRSPLFSSRLPGGKKWMKFDLQKVGKAMGIDFSQLISENPSQPLAQMQSITSATKVGTEQIDGVQTTHYRVHIDPAKLPQGPKILALTHAKYSPEDIWIDDQGRVRRVSVQYSVSMSGASQMQAFTMDFSNFGEIVSAKVPPASQVFDASRYGIKGLGG